MSCDFFICSCFQGVNKEIIYGFLDRIGGEGEPLSLGEPQQDLLDFAREIWELYPPLESISEEDMTALNDCPWAIDFDTIDGYIYMCCKWSALDDEEFVGNLNDLVNKHQLCLYDPQNDELYDTK